MEEHPVLLTEEGLTKLKQELEHLKTVRRIPLRLIVENAGEEGSVVVDKVMSTGGATFGYDAELNEYGDLLEKGIIDPAKVVRAALENASSIAGMVLTTESLLTDIPEPTPAMPPGPPMDM